MAQRKSQHKPKLTHLAFYANHLSSQAPEDKPKKWFWKGLERFANTGDSLKDYSDLSQAWPTFWPVNIEGRNPASAVKVPICLNWREEAHPLFLFYRDLLRSCWVRDPRTSTNGMFINVLFGLDLPNEQAKKCFPGLEFAGATTSFYPEWGAGVIQFVSNTDFQRAVWLLFCELWRAKMCTFCSVYFIAEKPAQTHCSVSCSRRAHQSISLKWWREKGARRRTTRAQTKRRKK